MKKLLPILLLTIIVFASCDETEIDKNFYTNYTVQVLVSTNLDSVFVENWDKPGTFIRIPNGMGYLYSNSFLEGDSIGAIGFSIDYDTGYIACMTVIDADTISIDSSFHFSGKTEFEYKYILP